MNTGLRSLGRLALVAVFIVLYELGAAFFLDYIFALGPGVVDGPNAIRTVAFLGYIVVPIASSAGLAFLLGIQTRQTPRVVQVLCLFVILTLPLLASFWVVLFRCSVLHICI